MKATNLARAILLWSGAVTFFGVAAWLLIGDKTASAGTSAGFGTILLFLANLDRIESFKGFGLEAKTRELKQTISEAEHIRDELKKMSGQVEALAKDFRSLQENGVKTKEELDKKLLEIGTTALRAESLASSSLAHAHGAF